MSDQVLITGGAGYVGSALVEMLLSQGLRVRILDALIHGSVPSLLSVWAQRELEFMRGDVRDPEMRRSALSGVDAVVHLAAIVGDPACSRQPEAARSVNLDATSALVREASDAGVRRFVFASTCSNYGKIGADAVADEGWALAPVSLYAETKVAAELDVLDQNGLEISTTCLRLATVYGTSARMRFDLTVNEFTRDLALGRELIVYGEQFWRPYVHVRDAARAIALVLESNPDIVGGQVFNVGDTMENYRKLDIVELLTERIPSAAVTYVRRDEDPRDYRVSFDKIASSLGFKISRTVPDGIDEVASLVRSGLLDDPDAPVYRN